MRCILLHPAASFNSKSPLSKEAVKPPSRLHCSVFVSWHVYSVVNTCAACTLHPPVVLLHHERHLCFLCMTQDKYIQTPQGKKSDQEEADLSSFESRTVGMAVRHVVMAVHGIGQRMGGRTIVEDAQAVRSRMNAILDDHMHDEIGCGYIQVLPIQWRKNLDLEVCYHEKPCSMCW